MTATDLLSELDVLAVRDRHRAAKAIEAVRAGYVADIGRANHAIEDATDDGEAAALRLARTILVGISDGLTDAITRLEAGTDE